MVRIHPDPPFIGGVAQLGERLLCKQEVIGSIPFTSTRSGGMMHKVSGMRCGAVNFALFLIPHPLSGDKLYRSLTKRKK